MKGESHTETIRAALCVQSSDLVVTAGEDSSVVIWRQAEKQTSEELETGRMMRREDRSSRYFSPY
jgi:hypothetical protein